MTKRHEATSSPTGHPDALIASVVDAAPIGGILTDGALNVLHANTAATELLGLEGVAGHLPTAIAASRLTQPELLNSFLRAAQQGGSQQSYHVAEAVDGRTRCLLFEARPCQQPETRWIWWVRDVTATTQLQQFRLLAEIGRSRGTATSTMDLAERLVDAILELLGADIAVLTLGDEHALRPVAFRGMILEDGFILDPTTRPYVAKALGSGRAVVGDGSEWDAADQEMTGTHYILPLLSSGDVLGTLHISSLEDHSPASPSIETVDLEFLEALSAYAGSALANARLFEELQKERQKLNILVESIPEGVVVFTKRGDVLIANEAATQMARITWSNLNTDSRPYRLLDRNGLLLRRTDWPFFRVPRTGVPVIAETVIMDFEDSQRVLSVSVVPVPSVGDGDVPTYLATLQDITSERDKVREREGFLQIASHELRSPLTPLTGFLQMLRKQAEAGEEVDVDLLRRAEDQAKRLARLIDNLLDMTRLERGVELALETVDLRDCVFHALDVWRANDRGIELAVVAPSHAVYVNIDVDRMEQILTNLLENAVRHSTADQPVELSLLVRDGQPVLGVRDCGSGILAEEVPRVFDRFFSGATTMGGLGLGLFITKQLVVAHGGQIRVSSTAGAGATFEITLPAMPQH